MQISQSIKEKRKEHQLTQEQLAEKIYVTNKTVSNWETGKTTPDIDSLIRLAKLFDLSLDSLLEEGSNIVENIKKIEESKVAKRYFWISWSNNIIFTFIIGLQKFYGGISLIVFVLLTSAILLNSFVIFYFSKQVFMKNENKSPYQLLNNKKKFLLVSLIVMAIIILVLLLLKNHHITT